MSDYTRFEDKHFGAMDFGPYTMGSSVSPIGPQLVNTNTAINWGLNNLELTFGQGGFQQQGALGQLGPIERDELIRLAKLNQVNLSLHGPHNTDASGFKGQGFSEEFRKNTVREFEHIVDFADQIGGKTGVQHVPIVMHGSEQAPGNPDPNNMLYVVNQENGSLAPLQAKKVAYDEEYFKEHKLDPGKHYIDTGKKTEDGHKIWELRPRGALKVHNDRQIESVKSSLSHSKYWLEHYEGNLRTAMAQEQQLRKSGQMREAQEAKKRVAEVQQFVKYTKEETKRQQSELKHMLRLYEKGGLYVETEKYAKDRIQQTIVDVAKYAAQKKSKPRIVVENVFPEVVMGNPNQLKDTILAARKQFIREATQSKDKDGLGMSHSEAEKLAKEMIGMTFEVGQLNTWKKYDKPGANRKYNNDDIKKWAEEAFNSGVMKHLHISDNRGDQHSHLPVGWGNAPINEVMGMLRKKGFGKQGERTILETFGLAQYGAGGNSFGVPMSLYSMHTPLIEGGPTWEMAAGSYFQAGYPMTGFQNLPDVNYQTFGVGFSGLPYATGAQIGGGKPGSQFSGAPMS